MPTPAKYGWLTWNALRWGAAAACVVVVGAAVTLRWRANSPAEAPRLTASLEEKSASQPAPAQAPAEAPADKVSSSEQKLQMSSSPRERAAVNSMLAKQLNQPAGAKRDELASESPQAPASLAAAPVTAAAPSAKSAGLDESAGRADKKAEEAGQLADNRIRSNAAEESVSGKAKDAGERAKVPATAAGSDVASRKTLPAMTARGGLTSIYSSGEMVPRWTLSADSSLQRSFDSGKTWQAIPVPTKATLRALAAVGVEIWVGGSGGALCHSTDMGEHWIVVTPVADGTALTADIIGVEFTSTHNGKLTTATGETWTTGDQGEHWEKK